MKSKQLLNLIVSQYYHFAPNTAIFATNQTLD